MANSASQARSEYLQEIRRWAMTMLEILRPLPASAEKQGLILQVDKLKDMYNLTDRDLPAYAGAVAVLTQKATNLVQGEKLPITYSKEKIASLVNSGLLRRLLLENPILLAQVKEFMDVSSKANPGSSTLDMLSKSGH
ncbi:MAG: hypothetical protein HZB29_06880 [Nitrospinae bacterium]|nr:hypothetical protein [Nitrospinota bacterium]